MTTATYTLEQHTTPRTDNWVAAAVSTVWATYKRRRAQRLAVTHLHGLTEAHLRDIGISRSEIMFRVYGRPA